MTGCLAEELSVASFLEEEKCGSTGEFQTRREVLLQMVPRYQKVPASQKEALLNEIAAATGSARQYAMWLLNHPPEGQHASRRQRRSPYRPEVQQALWIKVEGCFLLHIVCSGFLPGLSVRFLLFLSLFTVSRPHQRLILPRICGSPSESMLSSSRGKKLSMPVRSKKPGQMSLDSGVQDRLK